MTQNLIQQIGKSQRLDIINTIKRSDGLSVAELAEKLDMSYMGVKAHCLKLHAERYLATWRRPKPMGRPEMVYRLTAQTLDLFPRISNGLTGDVLESAATLHGPNAAEKLLHTVFLNQGERYKKSLKGKTAAEKAASLAKLRDEDGYMAIFEKSDDGTFTIREYHNPMMDLLDGYPVIGRFESEMFSTLIGKKLIRSARSSGAMYLAEFVLEEA